MTCSCVTLSLVDDLEAAGAGRLAQAVAADRPGLPVAAVLLDEPHQLRPVETPGRGHGDVGGDVAALEVGVHLVAAQVGDALHGAKDAVAQAVVGEEQPLGVLVGAGAGLVLVHADLFDDDVLLRVEILLAETGPEDVGENVDRRRQVFRQDGGVEDGVFLAGESVVVGADLVEVAVDVEIGPVRRALEDHVFEEVRHARHFRRLVAGAGADEEAQGGRPGRRAGLADELQAVRELVAVKRHRSLQSGFTAKTPRAQEDKNLKSTGYCLLGVLAVRQRLFPAPSAPA